MKSMLKTLLKVILIGLVAAYVGCVWSANVFSGSEAEIYGWGSYLCFVIVACTVVIVDKINKK